jgi:hypothetical protein
VDRAANGAVPFAFYAVADAGVGVVVATQSWAGAVAGSSGKASGKTSGNTSEASGKIAGNPALVAAVKSAAGTIADAIAKVVDAATHSCAASSEVDDARKVFAAMDEWCGPAPGGDGARVLSSRYAAEAAKRVVSSQRSTLGMVRDHGERLVSQLRVIADRRD